MFHGTKPISCCAHWEKKPTGPDFYLALRSGFILAFGLVIIAIPLGGILAFLMVRTDLPGRRI
ncbi:hypothetical protein, partial [Klebsiella pneumoniae]|uniref:hypothetical protein n=1 Tax=Klebsiella pneumoniae TaxID=573 RepID=UPI003EDF3A75